MIDNEIETFGSKLVLRVDQNELENVILHIEGLVKIPYGDRAGESLLFPSLEEALPGDEHKYSNTSVSRVI